MGEILHRVRVAAPPERVYAALTRAEEVSRWWGAETTLERRVGGAGRFGFGGDRVKTAVIETLEPSRRVAWRMTGCFLPEWVGTTIGFVIDPEGEHSVVNFAHAGFADGCGCLAMCTTGWGFYLEQLRRLCEGTSQPPEAEPFVVHSIPGSPFGRAVLAALEEKGAPYRFAPVAPGTLRGEAHLARHPFGKIPVLEQAGLRLYEVQAILRHLDRVLPEPALTPRDLREAARMDQAMNINDWYLFQGVGAVIGFHRIVGPKLMGLTPDEKAIAEAMPKALAVAAELSRLLGDRPFLAGERLSLADLMIVPQLDFLVQTPEWAALAAGRPNLDAYVARVEARPSFRATSWPQVERMASAGLSCEPATPVS